MAARRGRKTGAATKARKGHSARKAGSGKRTDPARDVVRYAVVGLGYIAQKAVLPAFENARNSRLVALVSGDEEKLRSLGREYDVPITVGYDEYGDVLESGEVDAVYLALPNSEHEEYARRAARAGVHVLCEKPLATSVRACEAMIAEARRHDVRLMTAYRLHFERANLRAVEIVRSGALGEPRAFSSCFTMQVRAGNIRLEAELGGGTLWDLGIYCINAARYLFRAEPEEVTAISARGDDPRFREVDEATSAVLRFSGGRLATFTSSFGAADESWYDVLGTEGSLCVDPAYEYADRLAMELTRNGRTTRKEYPRRDQFGPELVYFSECVLTGREPEPSGREGLADVRVIEALYESARRGRSVALDDFTRRHRPTIEQEIHRPPVEEPDLVHAAPPGME
jgi:glucose-fructose oxidoreductase